MNNLKISIGKLLQAIKGVSGIIHFTAYKLYMLKNMTILKHGTKKQKRPIRRKLKKLKKKLEVVLNE